MKGTEVFKSTIYAYLQGRTVSDPLFAETLKKPNKNIDDCITYILNTVKSSGCNGFTDQEVYDMAVHYYDEDNINIGDKVNSGAVVVNHHADPVITYGSKEEKPRQQQKPNKKSVAKEELLIPKEKATQTVLTLF